MLWTIAGLLIAFWIIGFATHLLGGFIHILLVLAVVTVLIRIIKGNSAV